MDGLEVGREVTSQFVYYFNKVSIEFIILKDIKWCRRVEFLSV